jgi:hypothetical protein
MVGWVVFNVAGVLLLLLLLYFGNILILWTLTVKRCMAIGARPHVCGDFNVYLSSR